MTNKVKNSIVYWATDSMSAAICVAKGSKSATTQQLVFEITQLCMEIGVTVVPLHLKREDPRIVQADEGSKTPDSDNWSIDEVSFNKLHAIFHFDFDLFASQDNARVPRFCSLYYQPLAEAVEAWSIPWGSLGMLWVCPPVSELIMFHHRLLKTKCKGVLCMPLWSTASFYPFYFDNTGTPRPPFMFIWKWSPYIVQNEGARHTPLFGHTNFPFVALYFDTCNTV